MKLERMIGILAILLQHEKVTAPYLAETFEVSRRTIQRDIEALCMAGDAHILIDLSSWYKSSLAPKIELLHEAIQSGRTVTFAYFAPGGETKRTVEPYDLIFQWTSWYLWGFCSSREEFRLFKLGRMTDVRLGEAFQKRAAPLPDFSPQRVFPDAYQIKAVIWPQYKWRLIEDFGPESFTTQADGTLLFSFGFADKTSAIGWIVSFGDGAELLEPVEFRKDILAFAEGIREKYR